MIIYIITCLVLFIIGIVSLFFTNKNNKKYKLLFLIPSFLIIYLLSILKSVNVGRDTIAYYDFYKSLESIPWENILSARFELGYSLLNKIFVSLHAPFWLFSAFAYLIVYLPLFFILYKRCDFPHVAILFTIGFFLAFLLSGLRQSMSISLTLLALYFFAKKKPLYYIPERGRGKCPAICLSGAV